MLKKKSWKEKLHDSKDLPKVTPITEKMNKRWGTGTVVIPAPIEVDEIMRQVPENKLITINEIRARLAKKHGASIGCPMTTGILPGSHHTRQMRRQEKGRRISLRIGAL